ncbi:hypothetical protein ACE6H2_010294 [Prunus campanulata]
MSRHKLVVQLMKVKDLSIAHVKSNLQLLFVLGNGVTNHMIKLREDASDKLEE